MRATPDALVSAVITTWNAADYLREAIDSALAQTYQPIEIIVVDDGSTDHTPEVCAGYGARIRYFCQERQGQVGAFSLIRALDEAQGTYVAPLDHDDRWLPEKIERQVAAMLAQPEAGVVFTNARLIDAAGNIKGPTWLKGLSGEVFHDLLRENRYHHSTALYPRAVLERVGHHDPHAGIGDWDQWLRISRYFPVLMIEDVLAEYRTHECSLSRNTRLMAAASFRVLENQHERLHPNCPECRRSIEAGMRTVAQTYLKHFNEEARSGDFGAALPSLKDAFALAPGAVLRPRHLATLAKSVTLGTVRAGRPRPGAPTH